MPKSKKPVNTEFYELLLLKEINLVGMTRFELATPRPPDVCATGLRYIPKMQIYFIMLKNKKLRNRKIPKFMCYN